MVGCWVPIPHAARAAHRTIRTIRTWANRGQIMSACHVATRRLLVWWPDVEARAREAEHRPRRHKRAA